MVRTASRRIPRMKDTKGFRMGMPCRPTRTVSERPCAAGAPAQKKSKYFVLPSICAWVTLRSVSESPVGSVIVTLPFASE